MDIEIALRGICREMEGLREKAVVCKVSDVTLAEFDNVIKICKNGSTEKDIMAVLEIMSSLNIEYKEDMRTYIN